MEQHISFCDTSAIISVDVGIVVRMLIVHWIYFNKVFNTILMKDAEIVKSAACHNYFTYVLYAMKVFGISLLCDLLPFQQFAYMKYFYWIFFCLSVKCPLSLKGVTSHGFSGYCSLLTDAYLVEYTLLFLLCQKGQSFVILWRHARFPASQSEHLSPSSCHQLQPE